MARCIFSVSPKGRVTIPIEIRQQLEIGAKDLLFLNSAIG
ncbi:MAG: AbrB/MazE/SpoVT family DNA-binding domain-containing protein [Thermomicrobiales bacterium]